MAAPTSATETWKPASTKRSRVLRAAEAGALDVCAVVMVGSFVRFCAHAQQGQCRSKAPPCCGFSLGAAGTVPPPPASQLEVMLSPDLIRGKSCNDSRQPRDRLKG